MRILFINDHLGTGGKERRIIELLKGLANNSDVEVGIVLIDDRIEYNYIFDLDISVEIIGRKSKLDINAFVKIFSIIKNFRPDIIHIWSAMSAFYSFPSIVNKKYKIINSLIADSMPFGINPMYQCITRLIYPISNYIIANSKAGLQAYNTPLHKSLCIYNGIDLSRFDNLRPEMAIKNELKILTDNTVIMVARFDETKDYNTYIKAAEIVLNTIDDVTFLAVGNGKSLKTFKAAIAQKHSSKIILTGRRTDVESIINIANVGVLSTNPKHGEGISNSILEYMALKKPVIASEGGGTMEVVENGINGYLIKPSDPKILAEKIIQLLGDKKKQTMMGLKGRKLIEESFCLEKMVQSYSKIYSKIVSNKQQ